MSAWFDNEDLKSYGIITLEVSFVRSKWEMCWLVQHML